jgi:hypothetical protein
VEVISTFMRTGPMYLNTIKSALGMKRVAKFVGVLYGFTERGTTHRVYIKSAEMRQELSGMSAPVNIAVCLFEYIRSGITRLNIIKNVRGMKSHAQFAVAPCGYIGAGITRLKRIRSAKLRKPRNGTSVHASIAVAQ